MIYPWKLNYWQTGEWQVANERLSDLTKANIGWNPGRKNLFRPLRLLQPGDVSVCIIGQDPYPQAGFANGSAFSVPADVERNDFPPTLRTILNEYSSDLGHKFPDNGNLGRWEAQGVLLWNAIPTCRSGVSLSHDWEEYQGLTRELVELLSGRGVVFALLGAVAKRYFGYIDLTNNAVIMTSHPSPRGNMNSARPFTGSRLFSTINDKLNDLGLPVIDWKLDDNAGPPTGRTGSQTLRRPRPDGKVSRLLQNTSGAPCCPVPHT